MTPIQTEVLRAFKRLGIRYLVIGGQAMRAYGINRPTRDLDVWVARDPANAQRLKRFAERAQRQPPLDRLQKAGFRFTVGDPANPAVDILTSLEGDPSFDDAYERRQRLMLDERWLPTISAADLLAIKELTATRNERESAELSRSPEDRHSAAGAAARDRRDAALLKSLPVPTR
jgi:hypothetical protein